MVSTIQVSNELITILKNRKMYENETYEDIIWDSLEDSMELSEETKKNIAISRKEIKEGKTISLEKLKKELGS